MKSSNENKNCIFDAMGCPKLTYNQIQSTLKVVHRADEQQEKVVQRFISVDPMAETQSSYTPYHYCYNNPVNLVDPLGLDLSYLVG